MSPGSWATLKNRNRMPSSFSSNGCLSGVARWSRTLPPSCAKVRSELAAGSSSAVATSTMAMSNFATVSWSALPPRLVSSSRLSVSAFHSGLCTPAMTAVRPAVRNGAGEAR